MLIPKATDATPPMNEKRERRKLWLAIIASLFLHVVVALSLAAFNSSSGPLPAEEDTPVELTMIDLSATPPPSASVNPPFVATDPAKESPQEPKQKTFESNANSLAASNVPASGDLPLPSQEGKDRPFVQMETQELALPSVAAQAQPTPRPTPKPTPAPTPKPEPSATPEPEQFAMLKATPPPPLRDPAEAEATPPPEAATPTAPPVARPIPDSAASGFQPQKQETRIRGRITNRGPSSVDAVGTPLGKYQKQVSDAIGARWYYYTKQKMDLVTIGTAHVAAEVDPDGKLRNLRVLSNNANEAFANVCLQSFQEAKIPPIPPDLIATLPGGKLPVDISFTIFANR